MMRSCTSLSASSVNVASLEFDKQLNKLQIKESEHYSRDWAGIEAQKGKIRFD